MNPIDWGPHQVNQDNKMVWIDGVGPQAGERPLASSDDITSAAKIGQQLCVLIACHQETSNLPSARRHSIWHLIARRLPIVNNFMSRLPIARRLPIWHLIARRLLIWHLVARKHPIWHLWHLAARRLPIWQQLCVVIACHQETSDLATHRQKTSDLASTRRHPIWHLIARRLLIWQPRVAIESVHEHESQSPLNGATLCSDSAIHPCLWI